MNLSPNLILRHSLPILFTALFVIPLGFAAATDEEQELTPITGLPSAPAFDLKDPEGRPQRLTDYRGKPLILNFWATWCPPCLEEMPSLERAAKALAGDGIAVVAINVGEDAKAVAAFLEDQPITISLPMDNDTKVAQSYHMKGLPATFVIDADGRIVFRALGGRAWDDPRLLEQVRALKKP
jgi:thiol-disulfide isomerase/thioredoxin